MKSLRKVWLFLFPFFLVQGCATKKDLHKLTRKVLVLNSELESVKSKHEQLLSRAKKIQDRLEKVKRIFDSFQKKGQYNFANIGVKLDELRTHHQQLLGKYQVTQQEFEKFKKKHAKLFTSYSSRFGDPTVPEGSAAVPTTNITPKALFAAAKALFDAGKYREARDRFKVFYTKFPSDDLSDDALIYLGDSFVKLNKPLMAIVWFDTVRKKFEKGDKVPDALMRLGKAHFAIKACPEGKAYLRRLLRKHKTSALVSETKELIKNASSHCKK